MNHTSEFSDAQAREDAERKRKADARSMACTYARVFHTDDGKAVLLDLQKKFSHTRSRFHRDNNFSTVGAAVIDGQCDVLREIEQAIKVGLA